MGAASSPSFPLLVGLGLPISRSTQLRRPQPRLAVAAVSSEAAPTSSTTKLLTFLGKGGSGKTTAAIFAAQVPSASEKFLGALVARKKKRGLVVFHLYFEFVAGGCLPISLHFK